MIQTLLDYAIKNRRDQETQDRDNSKFRVSDAGKCRLMRYWKREGKPFAQKITPEVYRAMELGIQLHKIIKELLQEHSDIEIRSEILVEDEDRLGHADIEIIVNNWIILYDFKTITGKKAYYLSQNGRADLQHRCQLVSYASMLISRPDELRLVYIERDSFRVVNDFGIDYESLLNAVNSDWEILIGAWKNQVEPAANPTKWECGYCCYMQNCDKQP